MVSQGEMTPADLAASSRQQGSAAGASGQPGAPRPLVEGFQKCPYLAGRPPCGTHHLFPSGTNVCWAEPVDGKPYQGISRETQRDRCFGGPEGPEACDRYRQAVTAARPQPRFEPRPVSAPLQLGEVVPPHPPSHASHGRARFVRMALWLLPLCLTAVLLLLLLR